ncbi:transposable element gene, partial [Prunus dulcis]
VIVSEMDKSWMHSDRRSKAYEFGVEAFLNFAVENLLTTTHIRCPCVKCVNLKLFGVGIIRDHVYFNGIDQSYKNWTFHGEPWEATTNASRNVEEDDGHSRYSFVSEEIDMDDNDFGDFGSDPYEFANVIGDGDQPVYPGCRKYTKKEYEDSTNCPTCGISRWKEGKDSILKEGVPAKVVWYFPPIPRFKRMFQSHETAKSLTWHAARKSIDGQMSHPADSPSWKLLDDKWPEFGNEPRNLRLALSSDGFNPHSSLSSRYSCWPVILVTYNLPPWLCMKRKFMMLTLLISGPKQPGNDIDVYLEPLIDDLKSLWVGIRGVYDAHNGEYFTLRAALMWTINDFPAYGNLSGCVVKGYKACPICGDDTPSHRLKNGHKICYIGHRKWLPINHPYRRQRAAFNGKPEYGIPPEPLTGEEVLHMVENGDRVCWKKKSIFFDLEYWKYLPVRHALDVMHIEKNVCDSIIGTLLEIPGKNKDGIAARLDLLNMGVKTDLQPKYGERRTRLPPGPWNLSRAEKREVPEGYSSNIKNLVSLQDSRLLGLKSHDCHTLMQQLLPVAIRSVLEKPARYAITRLCFFFNAICAKTVDVSKLDKLEEDVVVTLCLLEKYFPPSFFDIMVHLVVHLVREVRLCGPVYFRWMYPFERYMKVLKGYVQNRTRPEGCIAERYIAEEAVEFCTQHLSDVSTVGVPSSQKMGVSKPLSGCTVSVVDQDLLNQAHLYVLENTEEVLPYIEQHMIHIKTAYPKFRKRTKWLQDKHNSTFIQWLRFKVQSELEEDNHGVSENLRWLAAGPNMAVPLYRSYLIKGIKFNIKAQDDVRTTQNSGVYLLAHTMQVASAKDKNPILSNMGFYGSFKKFGTLTTKSLQSQSLVDELGFTLVDLSKIGHRNDQFVLASQVKQIFFIDDPMHRGWSVVLSMPNREYNDVIGDEVLGDVIIECEPFTRGMPNVDTFDELVGELGGQNIRGGCEDIWIE